MLSNEAFDCLAQSSSAIKVSTHCHVNASCLVHVTTGGQNGGKIIAPVYVQRWALTFDVNGLFDFSFDIYGLFQYRILTLSQSIS